MKIYQILRQSLKAILSNKGRSALTILGIVIGIGSVIALISLGTGVQSSVSSRVASLGASNLTISPGGGVGSTANVGGNAKGTGGGQSAPQTQGFSQSASTLTVADLKSLSDTTKHPDIKEVTATVSGSAIFTVGSDQQRYAINGVSPSFADIRSLSIDSGRFLTDADITANAKVAVLGHQVAIDVLGGTNVVGKTITITNVDYQVVGVLAQADESGFTNPNANIDIPYTTALKAFNVENLSSMTVMATSQDNVDAAKADIISTLLTNHKITNARLADFSVNSSKDLLSTITQITGLLTALLAGIAAISLVVGGIGIMNIMLVSVTERTREIGLRKAVGAKTSDILGQFVTEAIMLTLLGGLLGIGLGWAIGRVAMRLSSQLNPVITPSAVLLAVGVSSAVGLVFGIYPAFKASRLNPIDALRYE